LEKQGFKPDAAATVARYYKDSIALLNGQAVAQPEVQEEQFPLPRLAEHNNALTVPTPRHGGGVTGAVTGDMGSARSEAIGTRSMPFRITMNGDKLHIEADVDLKSLRKLMTVLRAQESILEEIGGDDDESGVLE
jgi:hypothetical protein